MCSSSSGNAEVSSDGGGRVQGRFDRTFDRAMPVLRRLTGWHAIAMLSPAVEPKGAGWVLARLTPSAGKELEACGDAIWPSFPALWPPLCSGRAAPDEWRQLVRRPHSSRQGLT